MVESCRIVSTGRMLRLVSNSRTLTSSGIVSNNRTLSKGVE